MKHVMWTNKVELNRLEKNGSFLCKPFKTAEFQIMVKLDIEKPERTGTITESQLEFLIRAYLGTKQGYRNKEALKLKKEIFGE